MPISSRMITAIAAPMVLGALSSDPAIARSEGDLQGDWRASIGAGAIIMPEYEGSRDHVVRPIPIIALDYKDIVSIRGPQLAVSALRFDLADKLKLRLGAMARFRQGRDEDDNPDLLGLGDVDGSLELGGFARIESDRWWIQLSSGKDVAGGHEGLVVEIQTGVRFDLTPSLDANLGMDASWADRKYMRSNFGITPAQSAASGLATFVPDSGVKDIGLSAGLDYRLGGRWSLGGGVGYRRLLGDAENGPIVTERGSKNQAYGLLHLSYRL